tara:strand:- start:431 stop:2224 length:1794 start_codon:yes stop_codon:yes gene_type:complete
MVTPKEIIDKVETHKQVTQPLRDRFEQDFSLYRQDERLPPEPDIGAHRHEGYRTFTSPMPGYFADKVMNWCSAAAMTAMCPTHDKRLHNREIDNLKEKFWMAALRQADDRLLDQGQPILKEQLAWQAVLRGPSCGRALIRKIGKEKVFDIFPWDPLHTYWGIGANGLNWICYAVKKTAAEIRDEWDFEVEHGDEDSFLVYDYYNREINTVVANVSDGHVLKKPEKHGDTGVPAWLAFPGSIPLLQSEDVRDTIGDFAESVFKGVRKTVPSYNLVMSIMEELVDRSASAAMTITSPGGREQLEEHPAQTGAVTPLPEGTKLDVIPLMEMIKDTGAFVGLLSGEMQRASLPFSAYGEINFTLSGFAITQLRQGIDTVIEPRLRLMENSYRQIEKLLTRQYASGRFGRGITVNGFDSKNAFFSETIPKEIIDEACAVQVKLVGQLPQDDLAKVNQAAMMRDASTGSPMAADPWIDENVLGIQDVEHFERQKKEQMAERSSPLATWWTLFEAAKRQGNDDIAQILLGQMMLLIRQQQMEMEQAGVQGGSLGGAPGGPPGVDPRVLSAPNQGAPRPEPNGQFGPNVPPGQPRPGGRNPENLL